MKTCRILCMFCGKHLPGYDVVVDQYLNSPLTKRSVVICETNKTKKVHVILNDFLLNNVNRLLSISLKRVFGCKRYFLAIVCWVMSNICGELILKFYFCLKRETYQISFNLMQKISDLFSRKAI